MENERLELGEESPVFWVEVGCSIKHNYFQYYPVTVTPDDLGNDALDRRISKGLFTFTPLDPDHLYCKQTGGFQLLTL